MKIPAVIKNEINIRGLKLEWVINRMNDINPSINMNYIKFCAITKGLRKLSCDEMLAFCMVLELNPDIFLTCDGA